MTQMAPATVAERYAGKNLLVTGTTGFVGKVFLEKLLRSCPHTGTIKVIVRGNRQYPNAGDRFHSEVLTSSLFDRLRQQRPDFANKIEVIDAQLTEAFLGMDRERFDAMGRDLDLIVNCAASVNFREALDQAIRINLNSVQSMIGLSQEHNIPLLHVSTCYVHGYHQGEITETLHHPTGPVPLSRDGAFDIEAMLTRMHDQIAAIETGVDAPEQREEALVQLGARLANHYGFNDVYTLTKWMGEALIHQTLSAQSVTIVRPAIVESCLTEPAPGWVEGLKVCDAVIWAYAKGKTAFLPGRAGSSIDIIPVDLVANAMVLAGAKALGGLARMETYQVASSSVNPITMDQFRRLTMDFSLRNWQSMDRLFQKAPAKRFGLLAPWLFNALMMASASYLKLAARFGGKSSTKLYSQFQTTRQLAVVFGFYTASRYAFRIDNLKTLEKEFAGDQAEFPVDPDAIEWRSYVETHIAGLNRYAIKERQPRKATGKPTTDTWTEERPLKPA